MMSAPHPSSALPSDVPRVPDALGTCADATGSQAASPRVLEAPQGPADEHTPSSDLPAPSVPLDKPAPLRLPKVKPRSVTWNDWVETLRQHGSRVHVEQALKDTSTAGELHAFCSLLDHKDIDRKRWVKNVCREIKRREFMEGVLEHIKLTMSPHAWGRFCVELGRLSIQPYFLNKALEELTVKEVLDEIVISEEDLAFVRSQDKFLIEKWMEDHPGMTRDLVTLMSVDMPVIKNWPWLHQHQQRWELLDNVRDIPASSLKKKM